VTIYKNFLANLALVFASFLSFFLSFNLTIGAAVLGASYLLMNFRSLRR